MKALNLIIRWSVSRSVDTYGYNVCTVRDLDTEKKISSCNGGGYDLENTAICDAICSVYSVELLKAFEGVELKNNPDFYGFSRSSKGFVIADGGCGDNVTRKLLEALGLKREGNKINSNCSILRLSDK
jgi:hypothetical protein